MPPPTSSLKIPASAYSAIQTLLHLSQEDFDVFLKALAAAKPALSSDVFSRHVASQAKTIDESIIKSIIGELFPMDVIRDSLDFTGEQFSQLFCDAAAKVNSKDFPFNETDAATLRSRLSRIFDLRKSLSITTKALDVLTEEERIFLGARILTDIRPIFNEAGNLIEAAVIVHHLKIHFGENDDETDFYVALDTSDIQALRDVLDRADEKAKQLQSLLQRSQISYLDAEE